MGRHRLLEYFRFEHLSEDLARVSAPFCELANRLVDEIGFEPPVDGAELTVALRKLLEAKDAAVRAALSKRGTQPGS